jgi:hypothetical protein
MKKGIIIGLIVSLVILNIIGFVTAIPDPAATYCHDLGYNLSINETPEGQAGICVFPDGSKCGEWQYYCKCEPTGTGCWSGNFSCNFPCKELPCKQVGESSFISPCCDGLRAISPTIIFTDTCNFNNMTGWTSICSDCGNGVCENWESKCNCPEDCSNKEVKINFLFYLLIPSILIIIGITLFFIRKRRNK